VSVSASVVLGLVLAVGVLLCASPWLWPRSVDARRRSAGPLEPLRERLRQAGLGQLSAGGVVAVSLLIGVVAAALAASATTVLALAVAAGVAAALLPVAVISARARSRRRATRAVWPDLLDHLVAGLRSGRPLAECLGALATSGPAETRPAFAAFERDFRSTGQLAVALDELKVRLADPVADRIVETLRMSREVGGTELPGVLRALAGYVRADAAVRAEVEARQSWVVVAARLGVAAPWIVLILLAARPETAEAYNSPAGIALLAGGLVVTLVAYRLMIALGRLPEERRWFA
jgi:tight adherence protein B